MNKRAVVGGLCLLAALLVGAMWWMGRQGAGGAAVAERANAVAAPSPWWGASGPAAGLPGTELPASGAPDAAEFARLRQAYERLSPEDRAAVDQARAYEGFMGRMQALLGHALQLKMAIARMAWQGGELDGKLAAMQQQFEREHAALVAKSDPSKDPTFVAFKAEESAMIAQARRMAAFPDGLTRDQYIIRESERIRARHYPD